ncbi:hypothetical protein V5E43_000714 [Yersinia enterocolitica]|uniref:hypothetical protein n=1 Tax=Yersinia TaxID=629 RepID=UPI0005E4AFF1|nr:MULTISPECIES: hypothetical protein [Yersinia]MCW6576408.1 hypothetical protein [Yersinia ruckeri]CND60069.1 putative lipoprotein [Yersinia pseudotuberculosis]CQH78910.1 putative lipoprotein [Yersinia enterocolitica]
MAGSRVFLIGFLALLLSACVTSQKQLDGSTKVRITNKPDIIAETPVGKYLSSVFASSDQVVKSKTVEANSLTSEDLPNQKGNERYLNRQLTYGCLSYMFFMAKSTSNTIDTDMNDKCRSRYNSDQHGLKLAGFPYDKQVELMSGDYSNKNTPYWSDLTNNVITTLKNNNEFTLSYNIQPAFKLREASPSAYSEVRVNVYPRSAKGAEYGIEVIPSPLVMTFKTDKDHQLFLNDVKRVNTMSVDGLAKVGLGLPINCDVKLIYSDTKDYGEPTNQRHFTHRYVTQLKATSQICYY